MVDKIVIDRAVVEQALKALEKADRISGYRNNWAEILCLRAALEQPQVEQEPVAVIGDVWTLNWVGSNPIATIVKKHGLKIGDKLYTHPQNLRCKSTQARLATLWGYEKPQPPRQPLTEQQINDHRLALAHDSDDLPDPWDFKQGVRAAEHAHGIKDQK